MDGLTDLLKGLPLPWLICALSWIFFGYAMREMWKRANELQDKNLETVKDNAEKLAALNIKITSTLEAFIALHRGGN